MFSPFVTMSRQSCRAAASRIARHSTPMKSTRPMPQTSSFYYNYSSSASNYASYKVEGMGEGTKVDIVTEGGHLLSTDIPKQIGGMDTAASPPEILLASWIGCTQATALFVGQNLPNKLSIDKMEFENIEAYRDDTGAKQLPIDETPTIPSRVQRVTGTIKVFAEEGNISPEQMHILEHQTETRCAIADMMKASGCVIDVNWVDGSASEEDNHHGRMAS